ncbi:Asp/Glu racemase [Sedimentitalea sp. XS_ASV28]|uniref:maleate cis-trans isomerase family protein n=1 Tax=Sedimentitalea sp. XS_ASV28 TaxID=3241296 RepID=UPI003513D5A7
MATFDYEMQADPNPNIGLIVLQSDERIEQDFRRLLPLSVNLYVSRVQSSPDVTPQTLRLMEAHIPDSARLLPRPVSFDAVGYGCTSGTAQIGQGRIGELLRQGVETRTVSDPLTALIAACNALGVRRLGFLSPYIADVSGRLRQVLLGQGVASPVFGTFAEAEEQRVARISGRSLVTATRALAQQDDIDAIFLSCTNLNTLDVIAPLEYETGLPILSSNLVFAWHLCRLVGQPMAGMVGDSRLAALEIPRID